MILPGAFANHSDSESFGPLPVVTDDYPKPLRDPSGHTTSRPSHYSNLFFHFGGVFDAAGLASLRDRPKVDSRC
jgi:hypothetical protein